jgi:hypothetical protein
MKQAIFIVILATTIAFTGCEKKEEPTEPEVNKPNWEKIKSNATFIVHDASYAKPYIQSLNVGGWEDGVYISRNGLNLYAYFMPTDVFSLYTAWEKDPYCFNYEPYYRPPMLDVDMISNPWGCANFFQADIIIASKTSPDLTFSQWSASKLQRTISSEGAPCGVLTNDTTYYVFVFTQNLDGRDDMDIMFLKDVPVNPEHENAVPIVCSNADEDNPHIERLADNSLLLFFDRDRFIYYSISYDNGDTWAEPIKISAILNDQAPYDVQPHLWNDGDNWWVYFCRNNADDRRCIYRSKQQIADDWDSWGSPELVIEPDKVTGNYATIIGIGEPSLTNNGDISFAVIYGDLNSEDTTDIFDCDPWFLQKK